MAICKMCHKPIPDGMDFCNECETKRLNQADESYLDSLLSSVSENSSIPNRSALLSTAERAFKETPVPEEDLIADISPSGDPASLGEPLEDIFMPEKEVYLAEEITDTVSTAPDELTDTSSGEIAGEEIATVDISSDDIPAVDISSDEIPEAKVSSDEIPAEDITSEEIPAGDIPSDEIPVADIPSDEIPVTDITSDEISVDEISSDEIPANDISSDEISADDITSDEIPAADISTDEIPSADTDTIDNPAEDIPSDEAVSGEASLDDASKEGEGNPDDVPYDKGEMDEMLSDLLSTIDTDAESEEPKEELKPDDIEDIFEQTETNLAAENEEAVNDSEPIANITEPEGAADIEAPEAISDDISPISPDDAVIDEISPFDIPDSTESPFEIKDITEGESEDAPGLDADVDAFGIGSPEDLELGLSEPTAENIVEKNPDGAEFLSEEDLEQTLAAPDSEIDSLMDDIESGAFEKEIDKVDPSKSGKKKKKSKKQSGDKEKGFKALFKRLFFNIQLSPEELEAQKAKEQADLEQAQLKADLKKKKDAEGKEDKAKQKEEAKAAAEEKKKAAAELKAQKKAEALEKAKQKKEAKLALEAVEVDEGRINRAGATILFVLFAILTVFIIVGTNIYSYNLSIKNAKKEFEYKHYNEAYYQVYGLKINTDNEDDVLLYDRIMTVMYVNTQLNSYNYYMTSNNRELALNSLIKGLQRYDKYEELATTLQINEDMDYVKSIILSKLSSEFNLTEADAYTMIDLADIVDYSEYIYDLLGTYEVTFSE